MQHHFISSVFLCVVATTTAPSRPSAPVTSSAAWSQIWEETDDCPTPFGMCEWEAIITGVNPVHLDGIDVLGVIILQVTRDWQAVTCGSNPQASGGQLIYFELLEVLKRSAGPWHLVSTVPIPPVEFQVDVVVRSKFIPYDGNENVIADIYDSMPAGPVLRNPQTNQVVRPVITGMSTNGTPIVAREGGMIVTSGNLRNSTTSPKSNGKGWEDDFGATGVITMNEQGLGLTCICCAGADDFVEGRCTTQ